MSYINSEEYEKLNKQYLSDPSSRTGKITMYVDLDGTIFARPYTDTVVNPDDYIWADIPVTLLDDGYENVTEENPIQRVAYRQKVIDALREWGSNPDIDIVFLTSWKMNACHSAAKTLQIPNAGYLQWLLRGFSDYNHALKRVAIIEDQAVRPTPFVWLEDIANAPLTNRQGEDPQVFKTYDSVKTEKGWKREYVTHIYDGFLNVRVNTQTALTDDNIQKINTWIDNELKEGHADEV